MTNPELNIVDSVLTIKASGVDLDSQVAQDLTLPEGKSIAQLLYDQENYPHTEYEKEKPE